MVDFYTVMITAQTDNERLVREFQHGPGERHPIAGPQRRSLFSLRGLLSKLGGRFTAQPEPEQTAAALPSLR